MYILGIESSCDETAAAVINENKEILSSVVWTQLDEHKKFGGVVPEIAARAHLEKIDEIVTKALDTAKISFSDLNAVAAAAGPGLIGGVIVGVMTAKAIAAVNNIPFIAVNHLEGHALAARILYPVNFPFLLLLTSGGHCQILEVLGVGKYQKLGATIDDAAGEAFDKVAKMLNLGYPGGPWVEKYALNGNPDRFSLPRPLKGKNNCDFSFSGLKTAVRHLIEKLENNLSENDKADISAAFQKAVVDVMKDRMTKAINIFKSHFPEAKDVVVAGGVAANSAIRSMILDLAQENQLIFSAPPPNLCTDNAAMIAYAALERFNLGLINTLDFKPRPRWPLYENYEQS